MGILEKIADIEKEMARTQKNKATEGHLGSLKAKLAKYRSELIEASKASGGPKQDGFEVKKSGDATVVMIGFPSVGKSTLLTKLTPAESAAASYEFTTLTCVPGYIEYAGSRIQLLDLPGIIEGASGGKGRGKQVIAVARSSDLVLMMLDASKGERQRELLEHELHSVGIRLNCTKPNIYLKRKTAGGISFNSTCTLTKITQRTVNIILKEYKMHHVEVLFHEDCTSDDLIDVIEGNRVYLRCLYCYNKCDLVTLEECDRLARLPNSIVASCALNLNFDYLVEQIWVFLDLLRIYTKRKGEMPDFSEAIILRPNSTVRDACQMIHRSLLDDFKAALVWGTSTKHNPQRVGFAHPLHDEDVIEIIKKV